MSATRSDASRQLWRQLDTTYHRALDGGDVFRTETDDKVFTDPLLNVGFVLRVAAALNSKPTPKPSTNDGRPANPFLPYDEALWVAHLSDTHTCLLNKFNVVPHHALVVTREFQHQTDPLTAADFEATLQLLRAMPEGGIAYFNSGPESGASQPHKHIQVVPLPLLEGLRARLPLHHILAAATSETNGGIAEVRQLPYQCLAARLQPDRVTGAQLADLAAAMLQASQRRNSSAEGLSYNVVLTAEFLQNIPRRMEASGPVSVNALGPAGTFFVKTRDQLEYLEQRTPSHVLQDVGFAW